MTEQAEMPTNSFNIDSSVGGPVYCRLGVKMMATIDRKSISNLPYVGPKSATNQPQTHTTSIFNKPTCIPEISSESQLWLILGRFRPI